MDGRHARAMLGVPAHATTEEVRQAFRRRAIATHPDHGGDRTTFELVVLAFETLQDVTVTPPVPHAPVVEPGTPLHPRFCTYDSPRASRPERCFDDVLRVAMARAS
jgi:hypothetical protein